LKVHENPPLFSFFLWRLRKYQRDRELLGTPARKGTHRAAGSKSMSTDAIAATVGDRSWRAWAGRAGGEDFGKAPKGPVQAMDANCCLTLTHARSSLASALGCASRSVAGRAVASAKRSTATYGLPHLLRGAVRRLAAALVWLLRLLVVLRKLGTSGTGWRCWCDNKWRRRRQRPTDFTLMPGLLSTASTMRRRKRSSTRCCASRRLRHRPARRLPALHERLSTVSTL
jgi:hypothetical protein